MFKQFKSKLIKYSIIGGVIGLALALIQINSCNKYNNLKNQYSELLNQNNNFKVKVQKDSSTIYEQKALLLSKDVISSLKDKEIADLKNVVANIKYKTDFNLKNQKINFDTAEIIKVTDTVYINTTDSAKIIKIDTVDCLELPAPISRKEKYLYFKGRIIYEGVVIDTFSLPDSVSITIGMNKNLFKPEPVIKIRHTNPYLFQSSMSNYVLDDSFKKYNRKSFWIGFGVGAGSMFLIETGVGVLANTLKR